MKKSILTILISCLFLITGFSNLTINTAATGEVNSNINDINLRFKQLDELDDTIKEIEKIKEPKASIVIQFLFIRINANFGNDEGFIYKEGRKLRVYFEPKDVTSDDSYLEIRPLAGGVIHYPKKNPEWPVQRFDTFIKKFYGSAYSSDGRIIVDGFGFFIVILVEWNRY